MKCTKGPSGATAIFLLWAAFGSAGCGEYTPPTTSPIVEVDSEEGKKARAQDEAERQLNRQKEGRAAARKKHLKLPQDG